MYKRPSKRVQRTRLVALYSFMTLVVAVAVVLFLLVVTNYRYDSDSGRFEQSSLIQFDSVPSGADVLLDGRALSSRTATKSVVAPGKHSVIMTRNGYHPWELDVVASRGELLWLDYIRLVPEELKVEQFASFDKIVAGSTSPDQTTMLFLTQAGTLLLADISRNQPVTSEIELPKSVSETLTSKQAKSDKVNYRFAGWSHDETKVQLWRQQGKAKKLIILNVENPKKSLNLSDEFSLDINQAVFSTRDDDVLYLLANHQLRTYSAADNVVSKSLFDDIASFKLFNTDNLTFETVADEDTGAVTTGLKLRGDAVPLSLAIRNEKDPKIDTIISTYFGDFYIATVQGNEFALYKGTPSDYFANMKLVASRTFNEKVESIEFNDSFSQILLRFANGYQSYSVDRNLFSPRIDLADAKASSLFWIDTMHLGLIKDGVLTMRDLDGSNLHQMNQAQNGTVASLSQKGTYFYSIGDITKGDKVTGSQLQRVRMIIR